MPVELDVIINLPNTGSTLSINLFQFLFSSSAYIHTQKTMIDQQTLHVIVVIHVLCACTHAVHNDDCIVPCSVILVTIIFLRVAIHVTIFTVHVCVCYVNMYHMSMGNRCVHVSFIGFVPCCTHTLMPCVCTNSLSLVCTHMCSAHRRCGSR